MNRKYVLRGAKSPQAIYVTARFGRNEKLMYATPLKCDATFWDDRRQKVKPSMYCTYADDVNAALMSISAKMDKFVMDCAREGKTITKDALKGVLDAHFGKGNMGASFHDFFQLYIDECDTRMTPRRGGQTVTYKTKREYARTLELLQCFERERGAVLQFEDIDKAVLQSFVAYLQKLNLATNTIAHKIISIKSLMRDAVERGLTENTRWHTFKHVTEETEGVALTEDELAKVRRCNLSRHPHIARIRDLFLIGCWTGLRYSDVVRLRHENIQGDMIVIQQQKTNNYVTIPVHPVFKEIWERYNGLPLVISNQKFNVHIKRICMAARINERVLKSITKGGKKITTQYRKWELVSSHTGRRTFATILYKSGFPSISIMKITGHKTEAAFLKYIKVSPQEHAKLLMEHWRKASIS